MMNQIEVILNGTKRSVAYGTELSALVEPERPCGGHGKCGKCKVFASGALSPVTAEEQKLLTAEELRAGVRLACCTKALGACTVALPEQHHAAQIAVDGNLQNMSIRPDFQKYGAAVDIGTTTLAAVLYDAEGKLLAKATALNPQSVCGADVVSRIEAALAGEGERLAALICTAIDALLAELTNQPEEIERVVITGNTVMLHLLTQTDPDPLARAPFLAKRLFGETLTAAELGLKSLSSQVEVYLPPCVSAFVGADTVCALLASDLCAGESAALLVDIGTNGEIALWHEGKLTVCSTAAGPAFEGAGISMGMRGESGAIDRVWLEEDALFYRVIGDQAPKGICGSGLVDAIACLLENETLDETGYLEEDVELLSPVIIKAEDIRAVQLAKSAIRAGMETALSACGLAAKELSRLCVAGGFGAYLDLQNAAKIGLLPPDAVERVEVLGNAALQGAAMLLLNPDLRAESVRLAKEATLLELAANPAFAENYMEYMMFE
ncbi:MAG: DUF4445 domain-containing protein [Clostridia bacterium]|nr:DUF4445 domain-containing protein [Clostridia bacterium]